MNNDIKINDVKLYGEALEILKEVYGDNASFRPDQYEAIESVFTHKRTLVVEKTGWGKSLIYFISAKMLSNRNKKATVVISPLLVLMDNQKEAAEKLGLECTILNSKADKKEIIECWKNNFYDIIFITPETLFSSEIQKEIDTLNISMFVIDEVHCISDYGHDFRLQYMRLKEIINKLPLSVPILGVTATATNRVIEDLKTQLGDDIFCVKGPLTRESLNIQCLNIDNMSEKYSWILSNLKNLPGTGIIYCLTHHDCKNLYEFLSSNGVDCLPYYSGDSEQEKINNIAIERFSKNDIKALIATIKLGMGYDKEDISFVIHLQLAENIVSYYQQIGRAGRNIDNAYIFLLADKKDQRILDYFINTAFPKRKEQELIYNIISSNNGIRLFELLSKCNIKKARIEKALDFLENDGFIFYDKSYYYSTAKEFEYNEKHYEEIKLIRRKEKEEMMDFALTSKCYSKYLVNALDDFSAKSCNKCSNCLGRDIINLSLNKENFDKANNFIYNRIHEIIPRKQNEERKKLEYINEKGYAISYYGDYGYGQMVEHDKYNEDRYRDEIEDRCVEVIRENLLNKNDIRYITCVPSIRNKMMNELTNNIANRLGLKYLEVISKNKCPYQKEMENTYFQSINAKENYNVSEDLSDIESIILLDDIVDSKWTLTWCGYKLMEKGVGKVYPLTISDSSNRSMMNE